MKVQVDIKHDLHRLEAALGEYPKQMMAAAARALNRTLTTVRSEGVKRMRVELPGLKAGSIRRQMKLQRATSNRPSGYVEFSAKRFRLTNFSARQTKTGVRLRTMPWRLETLDGDSVPASVLAHAFIRTARNARSDHVWIRVGKKRYPITALLAPSLAEAFVARHVGKALVEVGHARFRVVLDQEMRFRLNRQGVST